MAATLTENVRIVPAAAADAVDELLARDPVANVFPAARIAAARAGGGGNQLWSYSRDGETLDALCFAGANLVPIQAAGPAIGAFAAKALAAGRGCSSIVGTSTAVLSLWRLLAPQWGRAREIRACQPVLVAGPSIAAPLDPETRLAVPADISALYPAAVAMYTEEVGLSPLVGDGGIGFRERLRGLVAAGHVYVKMVDGEVVFKAEIGSVALGACQVQGVWTHPRWRGHGIATAAMATVTAHAQKNIAPLVTLYVNDFNYAARRVYRKCGFTEVGEFATVLF